MCYFRILDYNAIWTDLPDLCQAWRLVLLPTKYVYSRGVSRTIFSLVPEEKRLLQPSPIIFLKALKNPVEIKGMERAHVRDAIVMCNFLSYLEKRVSFIF